LLADASLATVSSSLAVLTVFAAVGLPAGVAIFEFGLRRARVSGTLAHQ
jgi:hypothetical protein